MKKYIRMIAGLSMCTLMLAGCGGGAKLPKVIENTTISIDKEGVITFYLVEEFNKEYYDVSELTSMAVEDVADYNKEHQTGETYPITVKKVEMLSDGVNVMVQQEYADDEHFAEYNEGVFFYGTVQEALEEGYVLAAPLTGVKDNTIISEEDVVNKPEKSYVLITDAKAAVYCPRKVTHIGAGAVYREDGSVDTTNAEGTVIILMK